MSNFHIAWIVIGIGLYIFFLLLGVRINGRVLGILIDDRNRMSLSRLQVVLWSALLISAFLALAVTFTTMNIEMPPQVWALLGISVGSMAGKVIVLGTKAQQEPTGSLAAVENVSGLKRLGILRTNAQASHAGISDLFTGEELSDCNYVDISKVQMFFFTIATIVGYGWIIWNAPFASKGGVLTFPDFSTSLVTLLGISHAGYLTVKAAPKTPTT